MTADNEKIWEDIYGNGKMIMKAPCESVVSAMFYFIPKDRPKKDIKILEVGCGTGANILFAAREGYSVTGVDISRSALQYARRFFEAEGLTARLEPGSFYPLPFEDESFDFIIDRGALMCADMEDCEKAVSEINRALKKGGRFLFTPGSDRSSFAVQGRGKEEALRVGGYREARENAVCDAAYYSASDVQRILKTGWKLLMMRHKEFFDYLEERRLIRACWEIVAEKE